MKKKFEMPAVNIHIFQLENVITASGGGTKTASDYAKEAIGASESLISGFIELEKSGN